MNSFRYTKYELGDQKSIELNLPQLMFLMAPQKDKYLEAGRGMGKSTVISWSVKEKPIQMPRGAFFLVGETYNQILTRTLPSTINGLEMLGIYKDHHYFVGRKAPAKWRWKEAHQPPILYDHAIHWITGACTHLISLDGINTGRGLNTDGGDGDEAALFDRERLSNNVLATNRGSHPDFKDHPLFCSTNWTTSVPMTNKGKWLYEVEEEARQNPDDILYLRADSRHNMKNLSKDWFKKNKRLMTDLVYNAEILNLRPDRVEGGFYAQFDEKKHTRDCYNNSYLLSLGYNFEKAQTSGCLADGDLDRNYPIDIALDWGTNICTIHAEQECEGESRGLKSMFILYPETVDVLINNFCDYFSAQIEKTVIFWYDQTAIAKGNTGVSYCDIVQETFIKRGWTVVMRYMGQVPGHHERFLFWGVFLKGEDPRLPKFLLNRSNCKDLTISMQHAGVLQGRNGFEKDKRPEKQKNAIHEQTTHFSDAADTLYFFKYANRLKEIQGEFFLPSMNL